MKIGKKAKKITERKPLPPFISAEQILIFDPQCQETFTESRVLNEVLLAIENKGLRTTGEIAVYLDVDNVLLRHTIMLETGMKINDIVRMKMLGRIMGMRRRNPSIKADEAARAIGYRDHATLYKIMGREEYDKIFAKYTRTLED